MIQVSPPFNIKENFWNKNFAYSLLDPFVHLYEDDSSKNKLRSSKLMWCFWLYTSPHQYNPFKNIRGERKLKAIRRYMPDFDPDDYMEYIEAFEQESLSPVAKAFKQEERSLIQRARMITKLQNSLNDLLEENPLALADKEYQGLIRNLDVMRKNTQAIYNQYEAVKSDFESEQGESIVFGGGSENFLDRNDLGIYEEE